MKIVTINAMEPFIFKIEKDGKLYGAFRMYFDSLDMERGKYPVLNFTTRFCEISEKGKDWNGKPLTEETLLTGTAVIWRNKAYAIGNRRNNLVELYLNGTLIRVANSHNIRLVKIIHTLSLDKA